MRLTKNEQRKIALERVEYLFNHAETASSKRPDLADRYVELALKLRDKFKAKLTTKQKMKFCKECLCFLSPGTYTVRTKNKMLLIHCKKCLAVRKFAMKERPLKTDVNRKKR